jgi:hypothetical protein
MVKARCFGKFTTGNAFSVARAERCHCLQAIAEVVALSLGIARMRVCQWATLSE